MIDGNSGLEKLNLLFDLTYKNEENKFRYFKKYKMINNPFFIIDEEYNDCDFDYETFLKEISLTIYRSSISNFNCKFNSNNCVLCNFNINGTLFSFNEILVHKSMLYSCAPGAFTDINNSSIEHLKGEDRNRLINKYNYKVEIYKKLLFKKWNKEYNYLNWNLGYSTGYYLAGRIVYDK